jgi:hypothetical protein
MNRKKAVLAALGALFLCSLVYSFFRMPKQERVGKLTFQPGMTAPPVKATQSRGSDEARVRLDLLERRPFGLPSGGRNIFQSLFNAGTVKPSVPLPLPPPPPPPEKRVEPPSVQVPPLPQVVEPTPLQRDMAKFTFLGFLKKENRKTIFLSNGKEIFLVKKGDKISGRYDVTSLTDEALTITSIQGGGEIVIPLVENRPLAAPRN